MEKWIKVLENDSFIVDFNEATNTYRVSYFEDYHFKDEVCFKGQPVKNDALKVIQKELLENLCASETIPDACKACPNHPFNGGSGICNCTLGLVNFT